MTNKTIKAFAVFTTILMTAAYAFAADDSPVYDTYGYDMSEDYFVARKRAIRDHKLLFVLSGSISCNYCTMTKNYLSSHSEIVDPNFVCYYAKLQNNGGRSEFQGGLPQYGTFDPRTVDAYTGCTDANGYFQPSLAWYSGHSGAFYSSRGYSAEVVQKCLDEALRQRPKIGAFTGFRLEGPDSIIGGMSAKYRLYADFDDGISMLVDHGLKWTVSGGASVDDAGVVTADVRTKQLTITCTNAFYDFAAESNVVTRTVSVRDASAISSIEIDTTPFNLEDNPSVVLKAWANLGDGSKAEIMPDWKIESCEADPLPAEVPLWPKNDISVVMSKTNPGEVVYRKEGYADGINVQDHHLRVTASVNGKSMTESIQVYGPSRLWASKWDIVVAGGAVAPGSVVKTSVSELKFTYAGKVVTTNDTKFADFRTMIIVDMLPCYVEGQMADVPVNLRSSDCTARVRLYSRRKGGKYTGEPDSEVRFGSEVEKTVRYYAPRGYKTCEKGIRVNEGWAKVFFPGRSFDEALLNEDYDGDGYTNAEEFLHGTDPTNRDDHWKFTACHFDWPENVYYRVMFMNTQMPGRTYTIEGKTTEGASWQTLGVMKGEEPGVMNPNNHALADACRYFRVKAAFSYSAGYTTDVWSDGPYGEPVAIPGIGVYAGPEGKEVDVVITPKRDERYPAFAIDANNLTYPIRVDLSQTGTDGKLFSVTTNELEKGQLDRLVVTKQMADAGWRLRYTKSGVWADFYATREPLAVTVAPGAPAEVYATDREAAEKVAKIALTDQNAAAQGQMSVLKAVATRNAENGRWTISVEIDPAKMPDGQKIDDTVAALGKALSSLSLQTEARAANTLTIPAESVTPGLYYSVLCADGLDFARVDESPRVLATGGSVTLTIPAGNAPTRFFKAKASMTQSAE